MAWAIAVGGEPVPDRIDAAIARETARMRAPVDSRESVDDGEMLSHGIVGGAVRRQLRDRVLADVVVPARGN
jgi:hypothetical protein